MAQREQKVKTTSPRKKEEAVEEVPTQNHNKSPEELKQEMDDLLDDIDEVLEENAAEFVSSYVQKGGQ